MESALGNINQKKARELTKIDNLERTYWRAWRRSCEDKEIDIAEKTTDGAAPGHPVPLPRTKAAKRREGQSGNPAFLAGVQWCIEQRCKITGIVSSKADFAGAGIINFNFAEVLVTSRDQLDDSGRLIECTDLSEAKIISPE